MGRTVLLLLVLAWELVRESSVELLQSYAWTVSLGPGNRAAGSLKQYLRNGRRGPKLFFFGDEGRVVVWVSRDVCMEGRRIHRGMERKCFVQTREQNEE